MPMKRISAAIVVGRVSAEGTVEVLLQLKRRYKQWEFPGGKLDGVESIEECVWRELIEETDINVYQLKFLCYVNSRKFHCMVFHAELWEGTPKLMEPDKQSAMGWFPIDDLPEPLTRFTAAAIDRGALDCLKPIPSLCDGLETIGEGQIH